MAETRTIGAGVYALPGGFGHIAIGVTDENGYVVNEFNGISTGPDGEKKTIGFPWQFNDTIKAYPGTTGMYADSAYRVELGEYTLEEYQVIEGKINMTMAVINSLNLGYRLTDQNSNSVARTILEAIGLAPPVGDLNQRAIPGYDRILTDPDFIMDMQQCFLAGTPITMADGSEKPIEAVRPDDWVMSFDRDGNKVPGRVKRTFRNEAKIVLDFHGTFVTPGHVYYCAGGTFEGQFVPLLDILRDDGIVQHEDGRLIRAATGCEVGSDDDRQFWAFLVSEEADGTERVRGKCQLRFGSRFMLPDGRHFSMRDYLDGIGVEIIGSGPYEGYARFRKTGLISVFPWTLSDRLPKPEDFILQRSGTTLSDIYRASEWEATHPRMAAPVALESGPVQPLASAEHAASPRNTPLALSGQGRSSALQLNRKARKTAAAKERREARSRRRLN